MTRQIILKFIFLEMACLEETNPWKIMSFSRNFLDLDLYLF